MPLKVSLPVPFSDALEFVEIKNSNVDRFYLSGEPLPGSISGNLCRSVGSLLQKEHSILPLAMHFHKAISRDGGLGGGSSDTAFFLKALNAYFKIGLSKGRLQDLTMKPGDDCPFLLGIKQLP